MNSKRRPATIVWFVVLIALVSLVSLFTKAQPAPNPGDPGPCVTDWQPITHNNVEVDIYFPNGSCDAYASSPYPAVVFAHGFSMFGLSDGAAENQGNGQHLASWGYVVAIPSLPDDTEERTGILLDAVDLLLMESANVSSFLYEKIDTARLAVAGYSLGGSTALSAASRDGRIKAVVALDPVYHAGGLGGEGEMVWDPTIEAPGINVPTAVLGAPADSCNAEADYSEIYPLVGAAHKAQYHLVDASHCVFADPGSSFCGLTCDGTIDPTMTRLSRKLMTAWFNYYLQEKTEFYDYLFGDQLSADIAAYKIIFKAATYPRGVTAVGLPESIKISWQLPNYPIIAGYELFRRLSGDTFPSSPQMTTGITNSYVDEGLTASQPYEYTVRSVDLAGNLHQLSNVVTAVPREIKGKIHLPAVIKAP